MKGGNAHPCAGHAGLFLVTGAGEVHTVEWRRPVAVLLPSMGVRLSLKPSLVIDAASVYLNTLKSAKVHILLIYILKSIYICYSYLNLSP